MQSLWTDELEREVTKDRLRAAGYGSPDGGGPRARRHGVRTALGALLVSLGERLQGICSESRDGLPVLPVPPK